MVLDRNLLEVALHALGDVLRARGLRYELVAIGGSGLLLLGVGIRPTKDLDVIAVIGDGGYVKADPLPEPLAEAATDVAVTYGLPNDWLNPGPASLLDLGLPEDFDKRTETRDYGGLILRIAGRIDQIFFKLYAAADLGLDSKHMADLRQLGPTESELLDAARWAMTHDPSPAFRTLAIAALESLGVTDAECKI